MDADSDPTSALLSDYRELNGSVVDELDEEPSPLEFMRYVARNTPLVVRQAASGWTASRAWNASYLTRSLAAQTVNVAVTPQGFVPRWPQYPHLSSVMC